MGKQSPTQIQRTERMRSELRNGRIVHLERHNTASGDLLEIVLMLDDVTLALLHDWPNLAALNWEEAHERQRAIGRAQALAEVIALLLDGEYTIGEVKAMNVLRYERHKAEAAAELEEDGGER